MILFKSCFRTLVLSYLYRIIRAREFGSAKSAFILARLDNLSDITKIIARVDQLSAVPALYLIRQKGRKAPSELEP